MRCLVFSWCLAIRRSGPATLDNEWQSQLLTSPLETNDFPSHLTPSLGPVKPRETSYLQMSKFYSESYSAGVGRVLVAARDISPGQTVLQETCLVATPDGLPVCLGCLGPLASHRQLECARCLWPVCRWELWEIFPGLISGHAREECQAAPEHAQECRIFCQSKITPSTCGAISLWYSIVPIGKFTFGSFSQ